MKLSKILKTLITVILIVPWSIVIILLVQIKNIVSSQPEKDTISIIEVADTIINKQPEFFLQTPEEGLEGALKYYGIQHKDIVYAQAVLETGNFKSDVCINNNNLFGLYDSKKGDYYKFNHWTESVIAYKEKVQNKYQSPCNYYTFLKNINYAEDADYIHKIKQIVKQNNKNNQ